MTTLPPLSGERDSVSQSQPVSGSVPLPAREAEPSGALKPSEVLDRAADLIEPEGRWTKGAFSRRHPRDFHGERYVSAVYATCFCALGAIAHVLGGNADETHAANSREAELLERVIAPKLIPTWNDEEERTQPEVVAALRKAAELARGDGQ